MTRTSPTEIHTAAPARGPVCGCLNRLRADLRPLNGEPGVERGTGAAIVYVRRIDRDGAAPPAIVASFCPICGEGYE